jgi:hypothetical protein
MRTATSQALHSQPALAQFLVLGATQMLGGVTPSVALCMDFMVGSGAMFLDHWAHGQQNPVHCQTGSKGSGGTGRWQAEVFCQQTQHPLNQQGPCHQVRHHRYLLHNVFFQPALTIPVPASLLPLPTPIQFRIGAGSEVWSDGPNFSGAPPAPRFWRRKNDVTL